MKNQIKSKIKIVDYSSEYSDLVSFTLSNKYQPVHRWYPFVEGFSSEFVRRIIGEQKLFPKSVLDPFGGIGTTSLVCQNLGIKCHAIENNPFFFDVARAKIRNDYNPTVFNNLIQKLSKSLKRKKARPKRLNLESKTFFENGQLDKWIFDEGTTNGIHDIIYEIKKIEERNDAYKTLFDIALASILMPISNVFRNGKCLSYKKNWQEKTVTRKEVHSMFLKKCIHVMYNDINSLQKHKSRVHNYLTYKNGDSRKHIKKIKDQDIDLIITSPPYLNSRDYTDVYRLELWILGYIKKFKVERDIRKSSITSHVQITLEEKKYPSVPELENFLQHLESVNSKLWNKNIPNMVKGYFSEMDDLLSNFYRILRPGGRVYLNVSNSAYGGVVCEVDTIIAKIAMLNGFRIKELRVARYTKSSGQQNLHGQLRESVTVMEKV